MEQRNFFRPCVIIPAFNEEKGLESILSGIKRGVQPIVIDDGSTDKTAGVISRYMPAGVIPMRHEKNKGKGAALRKGIDFALQTGYDLIITMDGDGQHETSDLSLLMGKAKEGFDVVIGSRNYKEMPFTRRIANKLSSFVYRLRTGRGIKDTQSGFRAFTPEVLRNVNTAEDGYMIEYETLVRAAQAGYKIAEVDIKTIYSADIKSKIKPLQQIYRFLKFNVIDSLSDIKNNYRSSCHFLRNLVKSKRKG